MNREEETVEQFHQRLEAAQASKDQAEIFSTMVAFGDGLLKREPPPTSMATGRLLLAEKTRENAAARLHNVCVDLRKLARATSATPAGVDALREVWVGLRDLSGWLELELEGPEPQLGVQQW